MSGDRGGSDEGGRAWRADDEIETGTGESRMSVGLIATAIVAVVLLVFIFQNTDETKVTWLFFDSEPPLWLALLVAAVAGAVVSELVGWVIRRRRD